MLLLGELGLLLLQLIEQVGLGGLLLGEFLLELLKPDLEVLDLVDRLDLGVLHGACVVRARHEVVEVRRGQDDVEKAQDARLVGNLQVRGQCGLGGRKVARGLRDVGLGLVDLGADALEVGLRGVDETLCLLELRADLLQLCLGFVKLLLSGDELVGGSRRGGRSLGLL